jgi:heme/copper-type cytochrome/quinol oxidase subunit 3
MSVIESHHDAEEGHHESPQDRHRKEHMAIWMFIAGDFLFFALEIFAWFYLRTLNAQGGWRFAQCTPEIAKQIGGTLSGGLNSGLNQTCTDGLGNPILHEIPTAAPIHTIAIAVLIVLAAIFVWFAEVQGRKGASRSTTTPLLWIGFVACLGAVVWQFVQFQVLPFTTIQGTYASVFEFFMGSNVAHFLLCLFIIMGLAIRSSKGKFENHNWYQLHLSRLWTLWVAVSASLLAVVVIAFA